MPWATTLVIVDAAVPTFKIQGASICDDFGGCGITDANGQLIYVVPDEFNQYGVRISHPGSTVHAAFGYLSKTYILNKSSSAMIQTVQLQAAPDPGTGTGTVKCFIVTAVTGSSSSEEVTRLRSLRDQVSGASRLAGELIEAVYRDYAEFSPAIAAKLEEDPAGRAAVLWVIVRPLLGWYAAAGVCALHPPDNKTLAELQEQTRNSCPAYVGGETIVSFLEAVRSGSELPCGTHPLLADFLPHVQKAALMEFASWAILEPIIRVWRSALEGRDLADEIGHWMAGAPLDRLGLSAEAVSPPDIEALSRLFEFKPTARAELGRRLAAAWPQAAPALRRAGFVAGGAQA